MHWLLVVAGLAVFSAVLAYRLHRRREQARAYLKGVRSMISDDPDAAIEALSDAARLNSPEAVETYLALGELFKRQGDLTRAMRLHRNMLHRPGLPPERRAEVERALADDHRRAGMLADAVDAYRKLVDGGDRLAAEGLRDVLVDLRRHAEAVEVHRTLCPPDPRLLSHLLAAASRELRSGHPEEALSAAMEGVSADPGNSDALLALAACRAGSGETAEACDLVASALDSGPEDALLAWPVLAVLPVEEATRVVDRALEARPGDARLLALRGRVLVSSGRLADSLAPLGRAVDADEEGEVTLAVRDLLREAAPPEPCEVAGWHDLLAKALLRGASLPRCRNCGASTPARTWRCPRCGTFDCYGG